jgi:hypothetical protein
MLTKGAIEAIQHFGSPHKQLYLPKMVSGSGPAP